MSSLSFPNVNDMMGEENNKHKSTTLEPTCREDSLRTRPDGDVALTVPKQECGWPCSMVHTRATLRCTVDKCPLRYEQEVYCVR